MFKTIITILNHHGIITNDELALAAIQSAMEDASEQAFNASRAVLADSTKGGTQVEIAKPSDYYIYPRFIDFKLDKL
jgi:2-phospho-L-lactate guanylyltransferase (CobY/MobA/RfbA family)